MHHSETTDLAVRAQACLDSGDIALAIKLYEELNKVEPNNAEAWLMSGALLGEQGSTKEAIDLTRKAIDLDPNYPEAYLTLAHLLKSESLLVDGYDSVKKALEIDSTYDEAWVFLGSISCDLAKYEEAESASREAIRRWPENIQSHISLATALCYLSRESEAELVIRNAMTLNGGSSSGVQSLLGRILLGKGEYAEAEPLIQAALTNKPDDITLLINLANIKLGIKSFSEAEVLFQRVIGLSPSSIDAWVGLGAVFQGLYNLEEAENCYLKAKNLDLTSLSPAYNLALLQGVNGEFEKSESTLRDILAVYPGQLECIGSLANVLEKSGEFDEAIDTLLPVLEIPERSVRVAQAFQRLCKRLDRCDEAEAYLIETLERASLTAEETTAVHFSLGDLYDNQGNYERAFKHYKIANENNLHVYTPDQYTGYINRLINVFSSSVMEKMPMAENINAQPIFIVGMPRSGTSLVEQILSSHPDVYGAGELRNIISISEKIAGQSDASYPECMTEVSKDNVNKFADEYLNYTNTISGGAKHVTDKMPHNFQHIGLIHQLFPKAKIIHCIRDAKDTCLSCYFQNFFGHHPYTFDLEYLGQHYNDYKRLMSHWKELEIPVFDVRYEDLVGDSELWSRKLIDYCGLAWDDSCTHFYDNARYTRTASYDQVRRPIYTKAIGRWKNYQPYIGSLMDALDV